MRARRASERTGRGPRPWNERMDDGWERREERGRHATMPPLERWARGRRSMTRPLCLLATAFPTLCRPGKQRGSGSSRPKVASRMCICLPGENRGRTNQQLTLAVPGTRPRTRWNHGISSHLISLYYYSQPPPAGPHLPALIAACLLESIARNLGNNKQNKRFPLHLRRFPTTHTHQRQHEGVSDLKQGCKTQEKLLNQLDAIPLHGTAA